MDSLHEYLKQNTASLQAEADELFWRIGFATSARYAAFIRAQARAIVPLKAALEQFAPTFEAAGLSLAPRMPLLIEDAANLRMTLPHGQFVAIESFHQAMGVSYVIERSCIEGRILAREIAKMPQSDGLLPVSFLNAPAACGNWTNFMHKLDEIAVENRRWPAILAGSTLALDRFKHCALSELETAELQ